MAAFLLCAQLASAQVVYKNDSARSGSLFGVDMGVAWPVGSMHNNFGIYTEPNVWYKEKLKHNILLGATIGYQFGNHIHFDPISGLRDKDTLVYNTSGLPGEVQFSYRGVIATATIGKIWTLSPRNGNSGIYAEFGTGFWGYHIRINVPRSDIAQLSGNYKYGYDKLTEGIPLTQFIGYMHLGRDNLANYFIGVEVHEGFMQLIHNYDYNTGTYLPQVGTQFTIGIKAGFILPVYHDASKRVYYY